MAQEPIDFDDYKLSCQKNILTCKPKPTRKGSPAVTVNLNEVVGVERNEEGSMLKLGLKMFSKECRDISIMQIDGANYLCATILEKNGTETPVKLMLDGNLSITIPSDAVTARSDQELCGIAVPDACSACIVM